MAETVGVECQLDLRVVEYDPALARDVVRLDRSLGHDRLTSGAKDTRALPAPRASPPRVRVSRERPDLPAGRRPRRCEEEARPRTQRGLHGRARYANDGYSHRTPP